MARSQSKLPTASRRDSNTSTNVEEQVSSPVGIFKISSATNVLPSSSDRSSSPEEVDAESLNWTTSNDPAELDAPPIKMTTHDRAHVEGLVEFYPTSKIRHCLFPVRTWEIIPWIKRYDPSDYPGDPFRDFAPAANCTTHHPVLHRFPVGRMDEREVEEYRDDPTKWFKHDYLSFYTDWSQMYYSGYEDRHDVFSFFTASGEMTSMVQWFNEARSDFDDTDINVSKICSGIWKRIHPPSYYFYRQKKIEASPDHNGYDTPTFRKMKSRFDSMPHSFSIMKKRVISIIAGNGSHFISYQVVNFGAHFREKTSTNREPTFIANIDSGDGDVHMNPFIQWLLAVIFELEAWVTQFLNTPLLGLIQSPNLVTIGRECKRLVESTEHTVCSIKISRVTRAPTQDDGCNCGIFSLLNSRAAFCGDLHHHVNWNKVHDAHSLWSLVLKPFWELPKKSKNNKSRLEKRISKFRYNFYILLREQARGLVMWQTYRGDLPASSLVPPLSTTSNDLANRITPSTNEEAEDDCSNEENDLDNEAGEGGNGIKPTEHADKSFAGMFSTHLKEKEAQSARNSKETRLQRGRWREISDSMTYKERQEYFKEMHKEVDEKALMSTQPERLAKIERKRKDREWKENSQVIQGIFRKKAKLLPKEKKHVGQILDEKFPITETTGETKDKSVSQITHLKYIPPRMRVLAVCAIRLNGQTDRVIRTVRIRIRTRSVAIPQ